MRTRTFLKSMALPLALQAAQVFGQNSSGRPIRVVVALPAGSGNDFVARLIGPAASQRLGQPVVIDNKPGASGVIGAMEVVRAAPDGLTLMCATNSHLATNVALLKDLPYDPRRDFTPIAGAISVAQLLVVSAASPIRSFADFIAHAKQQPGKLAVGYSTSVVQLQFLSLCKAAGIELLLVPYKGNPAIMTDMIGGTVDAMLEIPGLVLPQAQAGKMRALASMSQRNALFPDVPAVSETLPGFDFAGWNAFVGPAGMAREQVQRLNAAFNLALREPEITQKLTSTGLMPWILTPDELKAVIEADVTKYVRLAKEAGIPPQ